MPILQRNRPLLAIAICWSVHLSNSGAATADPFTGDARLAYETVRSLLGTAAERMPARKYSYRPGRGTPRFAELIAEAASMQRVFCGLAKGDEGETGPPQASRKTDLLAELNASFSYCDAVYGAMTDIKGATMVDLFGHKITKLGLLNGNVAHAYELYGTIATYLRSNGIQVPTTRGKR